ncbi:MAG: PCRF domain-containing protein, partial [Gallionellaceae bacterium]
MKPSIAAKLAQLAERLDEVTRLLSSEDATRDMDAFRKLNRERTEIEPVVELYRAHQACEADITTAQEMSSDPEMREFAEAEIKSGREKLEQLEVELQKQLLPKDPNDDRNVFLEVRAGTGGDEAAIFAGDIFRMYSRFAERKRWQVEIVSESLG